MCGKFTQLVAWAEGLDLYDPMKPMPEGAETAFATPMRTAPIIRLGEDGKREQVRMRWGFSDPGDIRPKHMHARGETIDSRPRFMDAFSENRGVLLVQTFNEGEEQPNGKTKQWVISPKDQLPIAMAVIWEEADDGSLCFIQVTTPANALVSKVTDRMPAILPLADWPVWLGEEDASLGDVKALLRTFDDQGNWTIEEQDKVRPTKSAAKARKPEPNQGDLF